MIVYKGQGIDWHSQSDSLGVSPLKRTRLTPTLISGSTLSSGKPKAIDLLYWLFHMIRYFCVHVMSSEIWAIELAPQRVCLKMKSLLDHQPSCCDNDTELTQIRISKSQILCTLMYNAVQMSQCYGKVPLVQGTSQRLQATQLISNLYSAVLPRKFCRVQYKYIDFYSAHSFSWSCSLQQ